MVKLMNAGMVSVLALAGCGGGAAVDPVTDPAAQLPTGPVALRVAPRGETSPVEVGGIAPDDTSFALKRGEDRVVILRHGLPDRAEFLEIDLPASVFQKAPTDSVHLAIRTRPGVYGADLSADADWGPGAALSFKYAIHFYPPADALTRYHTLTEVDKRLTVARRESNGDLTLYLSTRPAPDVVRALIPGPGTYVMVVGK